MSKNATVLNPKIDRRIRRTRDRLGDALINLILQKPFETVTVQEVLDRAEVSRSTFYMHYRNKEDLFLSDVDEFWEGMATALSRRGEASDRLAAVRELFGHIIEMPHLSRAMAASARMHDVFELAEGHFARGIEQRLATSSRACGISLECRAPVAHALAGSLVSLLSWWIRRGMRESPARMDELYHSMAWTGVNSAINPGRGSIRTLSNK